MMITLAAGMLMAVLLQDRPEPDPRARMHDRIAEIERLMQADPGHVKEHLAERDRLMVELRRMEGDRAPAPPIIGPLQTQDPRGVLKADLLAKMERMKRAIEELRAAGAPEERIAEATRQLQEAGRRFGNIDMQPYEVALAEANRLLTMTIDPQGDELDRKSRRIGEELRRLPATEEGKRAELKKQLAAVLDELFERREKNRWKELEELEARMKEMRKTLETRKQNKAAIIEKRAKELAGEKSDMDW